MAAILVSHGRHHRPVLVFQGQCLAAVTQIPRPRSEHPHILRCRRIRRAKLRFTYACEENALAIVNKCFLPVTCIEPGENVIDATGQRPIDNVQRRGGIVPDLNKLRLPVLRVVLDFAEDDLLGAND
jgi:hypothetical protein